MDRSKLGGLIEEVGFGEVGDTRLDLLHAAAGLYEREGVLVNGVALPLWMECKSSDACWARVPDRWRPRTEDEQQQSGGMPLPWVGLNYDRGGVLTLGINLNDASGLDMELGLGEDQLRELKAGRKRIHGSMWAYRSARSVAAVMRWKAGRTDLDVTSPEEIAAALDASARLQTVKCSPRNDAYSRPTDAMRCNCPPRYLKQELAVLRPDTILAFGQPPWDALDSIGVIREEYQDDDYSRCLVRIDDLDCELIWLHHPAKPPGNMWARSYERMLADLARHPRVPRIGTS